LSDADNRATDTAQANVSADEYSAILLQGAGTFAVESVLQTALPRARPKLLALSNGAYGDRIAAIAKYMGVETVLLRFDELEPIDLGRVKQVCLG
jgi:2-aminoethylphosphonate-pyruvate transaminase